MFLSQDWTTNFLGYAAKKCKGGLDQCPVPFIQYSSAMQVQNKRIETISYKTEVFAVEAISATLSFQGAVGIQMRLHAIKTHVLPCYTTLYTAIYHGSWGYAKKRSGV
jgi:hypothetical protein